MSNGMKRYIGIRHRVKATADGEARPTQMAILAEGKKKPTLYNLATEIDELDFILGQYPTKHRKLESGDTLEGVQVHHVRWRKAKKNEDLSSVPETFQRKTKKELMIATHIPTAFDGLKEGDVVSMLLGGSGDMLAYAIGEQAEKVGARAMRIPPFVFDGVRSSEDKDDDARLLAELARERSELFYPYVSRDASMVLVRELLRQRTDAMKARIACEQRLRQRMIGHMFRALTPEGDLEKRFDEAKANDTILQALLTEEGRTDRELKKAVEETEVWQHILDDVTGVGPAIAGRVIAGILDIRRFETKGKFKAFCGVHVLEGGVFPRKRKGQVANWHNDVRQALYLVAEQFNRRPDSVWGQILRYYKGKLREKHPEVEVTDRGKKRYTDGHIHKMALWRSVTKFVEWLFVNWRRLEKNPQGFMATPPNVLQFANKQMYEAWMERISRNPEALGTVEEEISEANRLREAA